MGEEKGSQKTLEMRVAELEDKLAQLHITEEEMKAYHKVASQLGASPCAACSAPSATGIQNPCIAAPINPCIQVPVNPCRINPCVAQLCHCHCIRPIFYNDCIGPCAPGNCSFGGTGGGGGGFGGFGT